MIIITNELLSKAFGELRVNSESDLYAWSVDGLAVLGAYGDGIKYLDTYNTCSDPQKYVDNWMNSTIAKTEVAEYYKELSFKGEDDMNKYETLLKKYEALYKDFEAYRQVTEDIADRGTYVTNEALAELLECKKRYEELREEKGLLVDIASVVEENKRLKKERDGIKKENDSLYKEFAALKKERDSLVQEVYYLHEVIRGRQEQVKEKMEKIKQRDKQITELINRRNVKDKQMTDLIKERDELKQRLEHINAMSDLDWKLSVVEETETTRTPYDELVELCENYEGSCTKCPNNIACVGIDPNLRPAKWTENQIEDYNELMSGKEDK